MNNQRPRSHRPECWGYPGCDGCDLGSPVEHSCTEPDAVNPAHYKSGGLEAIDVIEAFDLNFRLANACKYILRAGRKGDRKEDLLKAQWYISRELDKL